MGITENNYVDDVTSPKCDAAHLNNTKNEAKNFIEDSGQTHSIADQEQLSKGASLFAAYGNFYTCSGTANQYVLTPLGSQKGVGTLVTGMKFRMKANHTNTGAATVNVNTIGAVAIKDSAGDDLPAGSIVANSHYELTYDSSLGYFILMSQKSISIQDYTVVGDVGDSDQQNAGHVWDYTILDALLSNWTTLCYLNFPDTNILNDAVGAYDFTGVNVTDADNTPGILNTNYGLNLDGSTKYIYHGSLGDNFRTICTQGLAISCWFKPADGIAVTNQDIFYKSNVAGDDAIRLYIDTNGRLAFSIEVDGGSTRTFVLGFLPNGANPYIWFLMTQDSTYGLRLFVNGKMKQSDQSMNTLIADGTADNFYIGAYAGPANYYGGKVVQFIAANALVSLRDVELLGSVPIAEPASIQGGNYKVSAFIQPSGNSNFSKQTIHREIARYDGNIYIPGFKRNSTDKLKLIAEAL